MNIHQFWYDTFVMVSSFVVIFFLALIGKFLVKINREIRWAKNRDKDDYIRREVQEQMEIYFTELKSRRRGRR